MTLDELIEEEHFWIRVYDLAFTKMQKTVPGSVEGQRYASICTEASKRIAEYRKLVRNHPDHSYAGL